MICVTIDIYGGTPVRSWFTKKTTEKLFFHELISTFSLSYLSLTFASIIGADGANEVNSVFLHEKLDVHQMYSVEIWCEKVQTKVK